MLTTALVFANYQCRNTRDKGLGLEAPKDKNQSFGYGHNKNLVNVKTFLLVITIEYFDNS